MYKWKRLYSCHLRYYVGRKYMFDNNFKEAEEYLRYAFEKCDRDSKVNKRLILIYLVPGKSLPFLL